MVFIWQSKVAHAYPSQLQTLIHHHFTYLVDNQTWRVHAKHHIPYLIPVLMSATARRHVTGDVLNMFSYFTYYKQGRPSPPTLAASSHCC
jgi:hypothetical protein